MYKTHQKKSDIVCVCMHMYVRAYTLCKECVELIQCKCDFRFTSAHDVHRCINAHVPTYIVCTHGNSCTYVRMYIQCALCSFCTNVSMRDTCVHMYIPVSMLIIIHNIQIMYSTLRYPLLLQHTAKHYFSSVFTSFIDSEPKYSLPDVAVKELPQVVVDHPRIDDVDIYCWDEDINIVISGNDLWFVRSATVHKLHNMSCCLQTNNCNQLRVSTVIQENVSDFIKKLPRVPEVRLGNCFLSPVTKEIEVQAKVRRSGILMQKIIQLDNLHTGSVNVVSIESGHYCNVESE